MRVTTKDELGTGSYPSASSYVDQRDENEPPEETQVESHTVSMISWKYTETLHISRLGKAVDL